MNSVRSWPRAVSTLDLVPDGFEFTGGSRPVRVLWREIVRIDAGTRDYLTIDLFYVVIHTAQTSVAVDELADGFRQLEQEILDGWPHVRERWLALQAGPPRRPQLETLWPA